MTYIFNKESYSVERIVELPKWEDADFSEQCLEYYYKSPKSYPCLKDERWEDGKEYRDSEIDIVNESNVIWTDKTKNKIYDWDEYQAARLKPKEESQEELFKMAFMTYGYEDMGEVLKHFAITRK